MRVLGVDPGIGRVGFAVVDVVGHKLTAVEYGCITTRADQDLEERLLVLRKDLQSIVDRFNPKAAAVERLVFVHNATSALAVSQARGVILMLLKENKIPLNEFAPTEVKKAISGNGAADKREVGFAVKLIFGLRRVPRPDDAADALALAACHSSFVK